MKNEKKSKVTLTNFTVKQLSKVNMKQIIAGGDKPKTDRNVVWAI
jgi:hypothetical protein